jgi:hypothetical protein
MWPDLYPWVVGALGGFIGAALLIPTKLGEALIQFRTSKALEAFKAQQAHELEGIKERLAHLGDRGKRSNEMEFQAIETVWKAFVRAWLSTNTCCGELITSPDFSRMDGDEVRSFAAGSGLSKGEQERLVEAPDKMKEYAAILNWRATSEAGSDIYSARLTLREQRIFMPTGLIERIGAVIEQMSGVQVERRLAVQHPHIRAYEFGKAMMAWVDVRIQIFDELAALANERLFRDER